MANPQEGQIGFEAGGKSYTLELTIRAERVIQKKLKQPLGKAVGGLADGDVESLIAIFHAALHKHHPDITEDVAITLVRPMRLRELIIELIKVTYPAADDDGGKDVSPLEPGQDSETDSAT